MEEACTHWSRKVTWRCFLCTAAAAFTLQQLDPRWACLDGSRAGDTVCGSSCGMDDLSGWNAGSLAPGAQSSTGRYECCGP